MLPNIPDYSAALGVLHTDKVSVYRTATGENSNGSAYNELDKTTPVPGLSELPCRFSFNTNDNPKVASNPVYNPALIVGVVFLGLSYGITKGDYLRVVRRNGQVYEGLANKSSVYDDHQQIVMTQEGEGLVDG